MNKEDKQVNEYSKDKMHLLFRLMTHHSLCIIAYDVTAELYQDVSKSNKTR